MTGAGGFALDAYLERVGYHGALDKKESTLHALHRAQAFTIPFENFDILLGRGISLAPEDLFDKLVRHRRGGYCFELNSLLEMALTAAGFKVRPLLARVHLSGAPSGRGHMLLLVTVGRRRWIADVGFGGPGLRAPIPYVIDRIATQDGIRFRLRNAPPFGTMLQTRQADGWKNLYSFDLGHVIPADIAYGNHFTSTHPSSFFTYARVAALPLAGGRVSLLDRTLKVVSGESLVELELAEGSTYVDALEAHFGIQLGVPYEALAARPART